MFWSPHDLNEANEKDAGEGQNEELVHEQRGAAVPSIVDQVHEQQGEGEVACAAECCGIGFGREAHGGQTRL